MFCHCSSLIGHRGLSGSAACRWYINEDLPEINAIHARLVYAPLYTLVWAKSHQLRLEIEEKMLCDFGLEDCNSTTAYYI